MIALRRTSVIASRKGQPHLGGVSSGNTDRSKCPEEEKKYRDELADQSFRNKLKRFETLTHEEEGAMSPPPNHQFSYLNFVGEKLFPKDTGTTRLSMDTTDLTPEPNQKPKPEIKPKPVVVMRNKTEYVSTDTRADFKTLSMISNETSIWGSTSSAGTLRQEDGAISPQDEIESREDYDVFCDEMTSSLSQKHKQMVSTCLVLLTEGMFWL